MTRLHLYCGLCSPTISQLAALEALRRSQKCVIDMKKEYNKRRKLVIKRLKQIPGITCLIPEGAFYAFPNIKSFGLSSVKFTHFLLKKAKVLTVPGTEFGKYGEGYIRISYATSYEKIEKAFNRIEKMIRELIVQT